MTTFRLLSTILLTLAIATLAGAESKASDSLGRDSGSSMRHEFLVKDTAYQQFVLDSIRQADRARLSELEMQMGGPSSTRTESVIGVFIPIVTILCVFLFLWRSNESKKAVRLAMIERGMDPSLLNEQQNESSRKYGALRIGMLLSGIGLGILVGFLTSVGMDLDGQATALVIVSTSLLFGGFGLIVYHRMAIALEQE